MTQALQGQTLSGAEISLRGFESVPEVDLHSSKMLLFPPNKHKSEL
jgi:hypothetical protein